MRHTLTIVTALGMSAAAHAEIADFDDLTLGTTYTVGDSFVSGADTFEVLDFFPGYMFSNFAQVDGDQDAGGSGLDIELNNVRLEFAVPFSSIPSLTIFFGQYGGDQHLFINGTQVSTFNFYTLDGTSAAGVDIEVVEIAAGTAPSLGRLTLTGDIESFGISGQELWVDDLRYVAPSPGAATLIAIGMAGMVARRRE